MPKLNISHHKVFTGHKQSVYAVVGDGRGGFFTAGSDGYVVHWPSTEEEEGRVFAQLPEAVFCLFFDIENSLMLAGGQHGNLYILKKGESAKIARMHDSSIFWIQRFGSVYLSISADGRIKSWDRRGDILSQRKLSTKSLRCGWTDDKELWVAGSEGRLWELDSDLEIRTSHRLGTESWFALDRLSDWVFAVGRDAKLHRWNRLFLDETIQDAHWYSIHALSLSPDKKVLATGSMDKSIRIWDLTTLQPLASIYSDTPDGHKSSVNALYWKDNSTLISVSDDATVRCWKLDYTN